MYRDRKRWNDLQTSDDVSDKVRQTIRLGPGHAGPLITSVDKIKSGKDLMVISDSFRIFFRNRYLLILREYLT